MSKGCAPQQPSMQVVLKFQNIFPNPTTFNATCWFQTKIRSIDFLFLIQPFDIERVLSLYSLLCEQKAFMGLHYYLKKICKFFSAFCYSCQLRKEAIESNRVVHDKTKTHVGISTQIKILLKTWMVAVNKKWSCHLAFENCT